MRLNATIRHGAYLPHWTKEGATYAICFRLADSMPQSILRQWKEERKELVKRIAKGQKLTRLEEMRFQELKSEKIEKFLHAGYGACWLKRDEIAQIVANVLRLFDGKRYRLFAWCIMPNHVHVVVQPLGAWTLDKILHYWKRVSSRKINKRLGRSGQLWRVEYFDHIIRNEDKFQHAIEYAWRNPDEAELKDWKWRYVARVARATKPPKTPKFPSLKPMYWYTRTI